MSNSYKKKDYNSKLYQFLNYLLGGLKPKINLPVHINDPNGLHLTRLQEQYTQLGIKTKGIGNPEPPIVSLIIPVHVKEPARKFLMAISSLLSNKNAPPLEIIIVINGKVTTKEIEQSDIMLMAKKIGLNTATLSYIEDEGYRDIKRPKNIFAARQIGVEKAKGSILIAGDVDNIFSEHFVNAYADAFSRNAELLAAYGPVGFYGIAGFMGKIMSWVSIFTKAAKILINYPPYAGHNHAMRKEVHVRIPHLYSEHILVHENEIPIILARTYNVKPNTGYIMCIPEAKILTDFGKQRQSLQGAIKWFFEAVQRNIKQIIRLRRI
jgi:hypothetical protein